MSSLSVESTTVPPNFNSSQVRVTNLTGCHLGGTITIGSHGPFTVTQIVPDPGAPPANTAGFVLFTSGSGATDVGVTIGPFQSVSFT
jgi:hypothetical protein